MIKITKIIKAAMLRHKLCQQLYQRLGKKLGMLIICSMLSILPTHLYAASQEAAGNLEQLLANFKAVSSEFKQVLYDQHGNELQQLSGIMQIKKPNLFKWEIQQPEPALIISDGTKLWHYDIMLEQVTVEPLADAVDGTPAAFLLLSDISSILNKFVVVEITPGLFELSPNYAHANFQKINLSFSNGKLVRMLLLDLLEQSSTIDFINFNLRARLAEDNFKFVPPATVDIIGETGE